MLLHAQKVQWHFPSPPRTPNKVRQAKLDGCSRYELLYIPYYYPNKDEKSADQVLPVMTSGEAAVVVVVEGVEVVVLMTLLTWQDNMVAFAGAAVEAVTVAIVEYDVGQTQTIRLQIAQLHF